MKNLLRLSAIVGLLLLAVPAAAQDTPRTEHLLEGGYHITVPQSWTMGRNQQAGFPGYFFAGEELMLYALGPLELPQEIDIDADASAETVLQEIANTLGGEEVEIEGMEFTENTDGSQSAVWSYSSVDDAGDPIDGILYVLKLASGEFAALLFYGEPGVTTEQADLAAEIAASFAGTSNVEQAQPADCYVSTSEANTVQVRVGPGEHRSVYAFMPAGEAFLVTGTATADDGSQWYRLIVVEVAPTKAANEAWVAQAAVDESGDCGAVDESIAPPVVPLAGQEGSVPPVPQPSSGNWTLMYGSTAIVFCGVDAAVRVPSSELLPGNRVATSLTVQDDGALDIGGTVFTRAADGIYIGTYTLNDELEDARARLTVISSTQIVARFALDVEAEGERCTINLDGTLTRN